MDFNPLRTTITRGGSAPQGSYVWGGQGDRPPAIRPEGGPTPAPRTGGFDPGLGGRTSDPVPPKPAPTGVLGAEAVRATGNGPYDSSYRQNLASYAGGFLSRPGGNLSFDPTGQLFGNPLGGGNAPVLGGATDLISQALGGQSFQWSPPPTTSAPSPTNNPLNRGIYGGRGPDWLGRYTGFGRMLR
jgi:hypothetical protein